MTPGANEIDISSVRALTKIDVPFHDVDSMGVVWHGRYIKYLELARCELLESFGYNYDAMADSGYAWPIVDVRVKYIKPARFKQKLEIDTRLVEWEHRIKVSYIIRDVSTGEKLTKAYTTQMAVEVATGNTQYESPPIVRELLAQIC